MDMECTWFQLSTQIFTVEEVILTAVLVWALRDETGSVQDRIERLSVFGVWVYCVEQCVGTVPLQITDNGPTKKL